MYAFIFIVAAMQSSHEGNNYYAIFKELNSLIYKINILWRFDTQFCFVLGHYVFSSVLDELAH